MDDLLHIIFKRPDAPMDASTLVGLHMLAEPKLKRENIFGEGLMWGAAAAATSERETKLLVHVVSKPVSRTEATTVANDDGDALLRRHQEAIIAEIDGSGLLAMSTVVMDTRAYNLDLVRHGREALGRMVVVAEGTGRANETLAAFRSGLAAAMERSLELKETVTPRP